MIGQILFNIQGFFNFIHNDEIINENMPFSKMEKQNFMQLA